MNQAIGFLVGLILVAGVVVTAVVLVLRRLRRGRGGMGGELLAYLLLLVSALLAANAVAGLIALIPPAGRVVVPGAAELALSLATLVVAGPVALGLWTALQRRAGEGEHPIRTLYLAAMIAIAVVTTVVAGLRLGWWAVGLEPFEAGDLGRLIAFGSVLVLHEGLRRRLHEPGLVDDLRALAGTATGLVATATGIGVILSSSLQTLYDLGRPVVGGGQLGADLRRGLILLALGIPVLAYYWLAELAGRAGQVRNGYLAATGVVASVITLSAAAVIANLLLAAALGIGTETLRSRLDPVPGAASLMLVALAVWWYHRGALGRDRTPTLRIYQYLLAAIGLVASAGAIVTLLSALAENLAAEVIAGTPRLVLASLVALVFAGALVARNWLPVLRMGPSPDERAAGIRRLVVPGLVTLFAVASLIGLISFLFILLRDLLEGSFDLAFFARARVALSTVVVAGGFAGHVASVLRADRRAEGERPTLPKLTVTVVCSDPGPLPGRLPGMRWLRRADGIGRVDESLAGEIVEALGGLDGRAAMVLVEAEGFRLVPLA
jgi:hypothetical protein